MIWKKKTTVLMMFMLANLNILSLVAYDGIQHEYFSLSCQLENYPSYDLLQETHVLLALLAPIFDEYYLITISICISFEFIHIHSSLTYKIIALQDGWPSVWGKIKKVFSPHTAVDLRSEPKGSFIVCNLCWNQYVWMSITL